MFRPAVREGARAATFAALAVALLLPGAPHAAAQTPAKVWHIGLFHVGLDHVPPSVPALQNALRELGYEEGKNLRFDWRNQASEDTARAAAEDFVRKRADLLVPVENQAMRAAQAATRNIPIFFMQVTDPVGQGFVRSFAHPGGNVTGIAMPDLAAKWIEILAEFGGLPRRVLNLVQTDDSMAHEQHMSAAGAAGPLNVDLLERPVASLQDIEHVFHALRPGEVGAVTVMASSLRTQFQAHFLRLAAERRLPIVGNRREWAREGALFSYGVDFAEAARLAALYVDKILKGTRPADLAVDQATGVKFVLNLKTARTLGLTVPPSLIARADEVIE